MRCRKAEGRRSSPWAGAAFNSFSFEEAGGGHQSLSSEGAVNPSRERALPPRAARGFTLIEIMVVMALMALLVGLVPIAFGRLNEAAQYRDTVRAVLTDMRTARYLAQSEGEEVRFAVNIRERSFGIEGRPPHTVPEHLQMRAVMAQQEVGADGEMAIRFLPSGGASGGSVDLLRPSGTGVRLRVDWFSGRVEQEPVSP